MSDGSPDQQKIEATNRGVIRRLYEAFNKGDVTAGANLLAAGYVRRAGSETIKGSEGWKQAVTGYRTAFPDMVVAIDALIAEEDLVVSRWTARGTHRGSLQGEKPTGSAVTLHGMLMSRLVEGKIVEEWEYFEERALLRAIGAMKG